MSTPLPLSVLIPIKKAMQFKINNSHTEKIGRHYSPVWHARPPASLRDAPPES